MFMSSTAQQRKRSARETIRLGAMTMPEVALEEVLDAVESVLEAQERAEEREDYDSPTVVAAKQLIRRYAEQAMPEEVSEMRVWLHWIVTDERFEDRDDLEKMSIRRIVERAWDGVGDWRA